MAEGYLTFGQSVAVAVRAAIGELLPTVVTIVRETVGQGDRMDREGLEEVISTAARSTVIELLPATVSAAVTRATAQIENNVNSVREIREKTNQDLSALHQEMLNVKKKSDVVDYNLRRKNVRIVGLPETDPEDLDGSVRDLCVRMKLDPDRFIKDLDIMYRCGKRSEIKDGKPRPVLVKFVRCCIRDEFVASRRALRGTPVYVNEDLPQHTVREFTTARQLAKDGKIVAAWTKEGRIMIKKGEKGKAITYERYKKGK